MTRIKRPGEIGIEVNHCIVRNSRSWLTNIAGAPTQYKAGSKKGIVWPNDATSSIAFGIAANPIPITTPVANSAVINGIS
ncbi:MAG: hypothetical protein R3C05_24660 [Pirellulaceae bacterium]